MVTHDTKALQARSDKYRAAYDAATKPFQNQIDALTKQRDEAGSMIYGSFRTFADGLLFSATARCKCGAGLCYRERDRRADAWECAAGMAALMRGDTACPFAEHQAFPFAFYEIKSENQPSACGQTTRSEPIAIAD